MKNVVYEKILYAKDKKGSFRKWKIEVIEKSTKSIIKKSYGLINKKKVSTSETISSGKNIGKKNETTILEQAIYEAKSSIKKQKDKGYRESIKEVETIYLPMLLEKFKKSSHHITYPCYIQAKKNGIRSLMRIQKEKVEKTSRKNKVFSSLAHLDIPVKKLLKILPGIDGELFNPKLIFSQISSAVKREKANKKSLKIQYWIFDVPDPLSHFEDRLMNLRKAYKTLSKNERKIIKIVPTHTVYSEEEVEKYYKLFKNNGDEGAVIRNKLGYYVFQFSSVNVQKEKGSSLDSEFQIIGSKRDKSGGLIFRVITEGGIKFFVKIKGTLAYRKQLWEKRDSVINKLLTVKYQNLSDIGVPIFPVGLAIRDYE